MKEVLFSWFKNAKFKNIPINGSILLEKAYVFARKLGYKDFPVSQGCPTGHPFEAFLC